MVRHKRSQPRPCQHRMDSGRCLLVVAVCVLLSRTYADVSEVLACTLYPNCIDYSRAEGVFGGVGVLEMFRDTDLPAILLKEQKERLPSDVALSVCTMPSGDACGEEITRGVIAARTNILTQQNGSLSHQRLNGLFGTLKSFKTQINGWCSHIEVGDL